MKKFLLILFSLTCSLCFAFGLTACEDKKPDGGNTGDNSGDNKPINATEGLEYELNDDGESYSVTGIGTATVNDIVIASEYEDKPVTSIGYGAFDSCDSLTSVTIPDSVTIIGDSAFCECSSLISVTIPNSVTSMHYGAFKGCSSLESITIPDSMTNIGDRAFYECSSLTSITIPDSVISIGERAFEYCSLLTIYCEFAEKPDGWVSSWNYSKCPVVWDCKNNDKDENGYAYSIIDGIRYSLKDGIATVIRQSSNITQANMPASVTYNNNDYIVTGIGDGAFRHCVALKSITIPDSATSIGDSAFSYCSGLTSITIPNGVTIIGDSAFKDCSSLTSITFNGTKEQWEAIKKGEYWNRNTGDYTVHCTDGNLD